MRLKHLCIALAFVVGLVVYGTGGAMAASVAIAPKQAIALGQQADRLALQDLSEVGKRRGRRGRWRRRGRWKRGRRYRRYKRYRRYGRKRRYRRHKRYRKYRRYGHKRRYRRYKKYRKYRRYRRRPRIHLYVPYYLGYRYGYGPRYGRCSYWRKRCGANWGYHNRNYYGCLRYHGCR